MRDVVHIPIFVLFTLVLLAKAADIGKEDVDKVIEDEITRKLSEDFLQSLERKFQVDLQKSVDVVLLKIKLLLKNGTIHIQDRLSDLQDVLNVIKSHGEVELDRCLNAKQNESSALAEKALHQMVVCGYALIGHDPSQAVNSVMSLKNMIRAGIKPVIDIDWRVLPRQPTDVAVFLWKKIAWNTAFVGSNKHSKIYDQKAEVYGLLKVCGHDHDTLKKVIKCVISKSPLIKSVMMDVTGKLIDGVVSLTKLMAHGAMHEACLIEVIKTIEDEAFVLIEEVKKCAYNNTGFTDEVNAYIKENNATIIDKSVKGKFVEDKDNKDKVEDVKDVKEMVRRMLADNKLKEMDAAFKNKLLTLTGDIAVDANVVENTIKKD